MLDKGLDGATQTISSILMTDKHNQQSWTDYHKAYNKPDFQLAAPTASQQRLADEIEAQFGYKFKSAKLLIDRKSVV